MTVEWAAYAQTLTDKPMKGMLTGPVTICSGPSCATISRARDRDADRARDPRRGAATREPRASASSRSTSRRSARACRCGARTGPRTRVGGARVPPRRVRASRTRRRSTRTCAIASSTTSCRRSPRMDADVITIETSRSRMELLDGIRATSAIRTRSARAFTTSTRRACPRMPKMLQLLERALAVIPRGALWVNPDCGLKTRGWPETEAALSRMVAVARAARTALAQPRPDVPRTKSRQSR